jgi:hypothetical protein
MMLCKILQLDAETPLRHGMFGVARDLNQLTVLNVVDEGAGIGAILRARTPNGFHFDGLNGHCDAPIGESLSPDLIWR